MKHNVFLYVKNHLGVLFALIFFGLAACEEEASCVTDNTNIVTLQFTKLINNEGGNTEDDDLDNVVVSADGAIAVIDTSFTSLIGLPLDPARNTTTFYIFREVGDRSTVDTLVLRYQREQALISPECGPDQRFFNLDTALSTFDSIRVRNPEAERFTTEVNLQVFTCRYEMTNLLQLQFTYQGNDDEVNDTLVIQRIYTNIGKEDLLQNDTLPEGGGLTVGVPVARDQGQVQVFLETGEDTLSTYDIQAFYQRDTFQVADCLHQDRYRLDSLRLGENPGPLADPVVRSETFNINNAVNAEVTIH